MEIMEGFAFEEGCKERLSVIGLGKLGCSMLACFAHKGWHVIGVDVLEENVNIINKGRSPIYEPMVNDLIELNKVRVEGTTDIKYAVLNSEISFIIVPTPSKEDGSFSTEYVEKVAVDIARALREKDTYHVIVITSTVLPGDTARITEKIAKESGRASNEFGVCYNPDFIALGKIVSDFMNPDMILIGESSKEAGSIVEEIHRKLVNKRPSIYRMTPHNAELAKIALNAYCTLKITFANTIAEICENMPTGNSATVLNAIGSDSRVGRKYFKGGLAYSGPCFPRDNRALSHTARGYGVDKIFCDITDEINEYHKMERISKFLMEYLDEKGTDELAVLGLSYKEDTPIIEESVSIAAIRALSEKGVKLSLYDPAAMENAEEELVNMGNITFANSEYDCVKGKSVCFIATPWKQFYKLDAKKLLEYMGENAVIIDAWGVIGFERASTPNREKVIEIRKIGKSQIVKFEL